MFSLFQRKKTPQPAIETPPAELPKGLTRPELPGVLLSTPRRQKLLEHVWQRTSLSRTQFATLYRAPIERYAALVQHFPASESHHHAYPGGMLDHGLEIVAYALKLRQSHLLPAGASPETQAAQAEAWTTGIAHAALLHDIGKIAVDLQVELADGTCWHPWHGPIQQPYRFRYQPDRQYRLHSAATALLYTQILDRQILDWLSGYPDLWASFLYVMAGQYEHASTLGEIVIQADQASVAQELGGDPSKALTAPRHALQRKLLDGLRYLLKEELKLNQPQASDGWLTQDALWLVSKTTSDNGTRIHSQSTSHMQTRLGVRLYERKQTTNGHPWQPYLGVNWWHGSGSDRIAFDDVVVRQNMPKNRFELKTGIEAELAKNWTIWGAVAVQSGQNHFSDINGTLGARYQW